ncbi:MAG: hypothetical protein NWQ28_13175 [Nodularia sp. (in: cyanobacteria)]|nr:hypothetical protein [Nodularia sp. (in: cyanobacteria)]
MLEQLNYFAFGIIMVLAIYLIFSFLFLGENKSHITQPVAESWFGDESFMSYELKITREKLEEILEYRQFLQQLRDALDEILGFALRKGIAQVDGRDIC